MQFSIFQESRRGGRKSNQDRVAYCYSRSALLMLVADGMGGHLHGEIAAQIALQSITQAFKRAAQPRLPDTGAFLRETLLGAHHAIVQGAAEAGLPETPRTTCVACVVQDHSACWAHAGDARLYHLRAGRILAQTKDHSLVQQLIDSGRMREEAAPAHPARNQIFNCLGAARPPRVDLSETVRLAAGDVLLLCSDGLWSPLSGKIISSAILKDGIMQAVPGLLDEAERRAGRECDNLSAIAMGWEEQPGGMPSDQFPAERKPALAANTTGAGAAQNDYLSDDEIERAIAQIRNAIKRQTDDKT
jgi:serine/threonine protein phosphatase PrpC